MAKFGFEELENQNSGIGNNYFNKDNKVGYFNSLKNDGEEAIVRFAYSTYEEIQDNLVKVHNVKVGNNYRFISCLRTGIEPLNVCPLCEKGEIISKKAFIKLIEYVKNEKGEIEAKAKVWARPAKFALKLKSFLIEYGDLKNFLFKVKRHGKSGDMQTDYEIIPVLNKDIYKDSIYVKDFSAFNSFDLTKHSYYELSYDEVKYFVETGEVVKSNTNNTQIQETVQPQNNTEPSFNVEQDLPFNTPVQNNVYNNVVQPQNMQQVTNNISQAEQNPFNTQQTTVTNENGRRVYKY